LPEKELLLGFLDAQYLAEDGQPSSLDAADLCTAPPVACTADGRLQKLYLANKQISGPVPEEWSAFGALTEL
jgi:hypothetical protein